MSGTKGKTRFVVTLFVLVILVLGSTVYYRGQGENGQETVGESVTIRREDLRAKIAETGSLEPVTVVEIKSEQSGEVKEMLVRAGDSIRTGEHLALIQHESNQARQVAQFRANVEQERLNLEEAERELSRMRELVSKGFVAKKEVETAEKNRDNAKIRHDLALRQLLLILGGKKELYQKVLQRGVDSEQLDQFILSSPITGTILEVKVSQGEIVSSGTTTVGGGTTLMRIADLSRMLVKTKVNEVNIRQVKVGQPVELRLDALPGTVYTGAVSRISPNGEKIDNVVTYEVIIELENADRQLRPSMTANVDIIVAEAKNVVVLPLIALNRESEDPEVRVRQEDGEYVPRKIRLGLKNESNVAVLEGLREGEQVLLPKSSAGG